MRTIELFGTDPFRFLRDHSFRALVCAAGIATVVWTAPAVAQAQPYYAELSTLRLQVSPKDTQVYVDGYYSGTVDDFDGFLQGLRLEAGGHDITFYLDGYRTVTQKIELEPRGTFRIKHTMERLKPGEVAEPKPVAPPPPPPSEAARRPDRPGPPEPFGPPGPREPREPRGPRPRAGGDQSSFGTLSVRVQPGNADILIDGERWEGSASETRLLVQLGPGPHHIEIRREGYRSYTSDLDVRPGETTTLNVSLSQP